MKIWVIHIGLQETRYKIKIPNKGFFGVPRPDYEKENYCSTCDLTYKKDTLFCSVCKRKLRTYSRFQERRRFKVKCSGCGHTHGECDCLCCRADEVIVDTSITNEATKCECIFCAQYN